MTNSKSYHILYSECYNNLPYKKEQNNYQNGEIGKNGGGGGGGGGGGRVKSFPDETRLK